MTKVYNKYTELNKDVLLKEDDFIEDASEFLMKREGYRPEQLKSRESVYDAFMEHFRVQNVNEITALRDLDYVKNRTNDEQKAQLGRLMDTYDSMDSDFGLGGDTRTRGWGLLGVGSGAGGVGDAARGEWDGALTAVVAAAARGAAHAVA